MSSVKLLEKPTTKVCDELMLKDLPTVVICRLFQIKIIACPTRNARDSEDVKKGKIVYKLYHEGQCPLARTIHTAGNITYWLLPLLAILQLTFFH